MAADGALGSVARCLAGLAEDNLSRLKRPNGAYEVPAPGLPCSGAIYPRDATPRCLVCLWSDKQLESVEEHAAKRCHETKLRPLIKQQQALLSWEKGTETPEALTSALWCDGQAQLVAVAEEATQEEGARAKDGGTQVLVGSQRCRAAMRRRQGFQENQGKVKDAHVSTASFQWAQISCVCCHGP